MQRLLFLSTVYPTPWDPHRGPANRSTVESLRQIGCEVEVVAPVPWHHKLKPRAPNTPAAEQPTFWYPPGLGRRHYHRMMWATVAPRLRAMATARRFDAVLAFWTDPDGTVALRFAREIGVPCGIIAGGSDILLLTENQARRRVISATLRTADHIFAVGSRLVDRAVELGASAERTTNFLCGVDLTRFGPGDQMAARATLGLDPSGPLLLWVGNMLPVKAPERAIEALALLRSEWPELRLAMLGHGPLRPSLEALAAARGLRDKVLFPGPVTHERLPLWYQACDAFVLPSRSEGVPNVLLEAMATGRPFVASDVGAIRDLLPFGPSAVTPPGDIPALVSAVATLLRDQTRALAPVRHDRLDGARHLLEHLEKARTR